ERTLKLWRGEWGGGGMEACGLVMGEDFVAFVYPNQEPIIEAEIISKDGIKYIKGSEGIFNPAFTSARNLAREKLRQSAQAAT
ncbi:MAG TPA: hypothetical protein VES68_03840, partial [Candidatus Sulfotelmatobacter sp.]|nr:hypothetical protein [Candidatus Sulfotelmatobacter sp.]